MLHRFDSPSDRAAHFLDPRRVKAIDQGLLFVQANGTDPGGEIQSRFCLCQL
jgi:hypothetical protein